MKGRRPHSLLGDGAGEDRRGPGINTRGRTKAARVRRLSVKEAVGKEACDKEMGSKGRSGREDTQIRSCLARARGQGRECQCQHCLSIHSFPSAGRYWPERWGQGGKVPTLYMRT